MRLISDDNIMYHVSAFVRSQAAWKFSDRIDIIPYNRDQILKSLEILSFVNARGHDNFAISCKIPNERV